MTMNQTFAQTKLCFSCSPEGAITKVLKDDDNLFSLPNSPSSFFEVFDKCSKKQSITFWENIINKSLVDKCKLNTLNSSSDSSYNFSGFFNGQDVLITAYKSEEEDYSRQLSIVAANDGESLKFDKIPFAFESPFAANKYIGEIDVLKNDIKNLKKQLLEKDLSISAIDSQLKKAKANKEQLSFITSHDLKEPLRMIASYMRLLKRKFGQQLDGKANTYIDFAIDGSVRLESMFNSLLDLAHINVKENEKHKIDFNEIVDEVKHKFFKVIKERNVEIKLPQKLPQVQGYRNALLKLMENLIFNAIKFSADNRQCSVEITAKETKGTWEFCVADNGIGIKEEAYCQIFAVFSKLNNGEKYQGSGIGLAICKKAVEHNGGALWVNSVYGTGSNFYFTIPK